MDGLLAARHTGIGAKHADMRRRSMRADTLTDTGNAVLNADYLAKDPVTCEYYRGGWMEKKNELLKKLGR